MTGAPELGIVVIVDHDAFRTPKHDDGNRGPKEQRGRHLEARWPLIDGPDRRGGPIKSPDQRSKFSAAFEEVQGLGGGSRILLQF